MLIVSNQNQNVTLTDVALKNLRNLIEKQFADVLSVTESLYKNVPTFFGKIFI